MNAEYYISPRAITITPNAENNNPDYVGISVVGGTAIRVKNRLKSTDGTTVFVVGYAADLSYRTWTLIGGDTYVGSDHSVALNIYARLDASDTGSTGLVMLSKNSYDKKVDGYYYIKLGVLSAPKDDGLRELLSWDTGELDTNQGNDNANTSDFDRAFTVDTAKITPLLPFSGLTLFANTGITFGSNSFFKFGSISISSIKNEISGFASWAADTAIATTHSISEYIKNIALRKDTDDETTHTLTMKNSITKEAHKVYDSIEMGDPTNNDKKYVANTKGSKLYWNGSGWCFATDYLFVSKKAYFNELEINKVSHVGGQQILTACGCKVEHVYYWQNQYFVYFRKEDADGNPVTNDWVVGDLAYCQSFNVKEGVTEGASNRYYWAMVHRVTPSTGSSLTDIDNVTFDPRDFHLIVLKFDSAAYCDMPSTNSSTPCVNTSKLAPDTPKKGDSIVLLGHIKQASETDAEAEARQGATLLAGAGNWGTALVMWRGIGANKTNPFIMPEPKVEIGPKRVSITADEMKLSSSGVLELSSNQLVCTNKEGDKTAWLDELGNFTTKGIQSQLVQEINDVDTFLDRFIMIPATDTINPSGAKDWEYSKSNWKTFTLSTDSKPKLYAENYRVAKGTDIVTNDNVVLTTAIAPLSDNGLPYSQMEADGHGSNIHTCLDMRAAQGVIHLNWQPLRTSSYNGTDDKGFLGVYLPYFINKGYDMDKGWITEYFRTPTKMDGEFDFISMIQIKSLIGRKFTLVNNTSGYVKVMYDSKMADRVILHPDDYATFEFVGEVDSCETELTYYDGRGNSYTRKEVNLGKFMWQPIADESFLNIYDNMLDDGNFCKDYHI